MDELEGSILHLPTVNKKVGKSLKKLGLEKIQDLLFYFPFRYEDFRKIVLITKIVADSRITIHGRVQLISGRRSFHQRRFMTEAVISDETGQLKVVWFNQPFISKILKIGDKLSLAGKVEYGKFGLQMVNPIFEKEKDGVENIHTGRLVPVYPTTRGLTQKQLRFLIKKSLIAVNLVAEWLPPIIIKKNNFLTLAESLAEIHFPSADEKVDKAVERFQFEEIFLVQLRNELSRQQLRILKAPNLVFKEQEIKEFVKSLPFTLTNDQRRAAWEILQDTAKVQPMNRLLDGDVGSGKTVVAAMALYNTVLNGFQGAIMAPTEILALQHFQSLQKLFTNQDVKIGLLTSKSFKLSNTVEIPPRKVVVDLIKDGAVDVIVGTHALIGGKVKFKKLGLTVVDEQHRFGVTQRHRLQKKGKGKNMPHFLSMTATPIPRSYALALYGDLDLSLIKEMPRGRLPIITRVVEEFNRAKAYEFIKQQVKKGHQAFVVCPLIGEEGAEDYELGNEKRSVMVEYKKLSEEIFSDLKINFLHGKMKSAEKEIIMKGFLARDFDILVSTSVVEVGVDIANATVMMIEGAERFGLAQLHQFRGRVGRSDHQSYCLLFSNSLNEPTKKRLNYFAENHDGFSLAEKDLELRGPGAIFGTEQHGFEALKMADFKNLDLIKKGRDEAAALISADSSLASYPLLKSKLESLEETIHLE